MTTNAGICSECDGPATVVLFEQPRRGYGDDWFTPFPSEPLEVPLCQDCADAWYPHADIRPIEEAA